MKKPLHFILILFILLTFIFVISSCNHDLKKDNDDDNPTVDSIGVNADSFFWGTWVRMDNGKEYEFLESSVEQAAKKYKVQASNDNSISVSELGTFTKESDSVIVCDNIPYFRKGGTNLEYLLKIVGFESSIRQAGRAAGSVVGGIRGKGKSKKYTTFESDGESDDDGVIKLTAPTVDDVQTVTISDGNDVVVIPSLVISNSGDYMGTVALVGKKDYNLKITGTISDSQKDAGYLYGNNAKTYDMVLTITNISENKCKSSVCTISTEDPNLNLSSETNLQGFTISTLANGATKTINLNISYGNLTEPYVNTGINIQITNSSTGQEWVDYIPLRFFKGTIPITISAKNPENNKNAALNGFVIYPDGNNQFFAIPHNSSKPVFVPTFGKEKSYKLVFSGATVTSKLDDSTEMFYSVEPASLNTRTVVTEGDAQELIEYMNFGGDNHSETTAYSVTQGFEAYLSEGEIDYYTISADSDYYYSSEQIPLFEVSYENEKGSAPETILVKAGSSLTSDQLPELKYEGFEFLGWYDGEKKVVAGDIINENLMLNAKWKKVLFIVSFQTEYDEVPKSITVYDGTILKSDNLPLLDDEVYLFGGWYDGDKQVQIGNYVVNKDVTLVAKWNKKCLISYVSEYGIVPETIVFGSGNKLTEEQLPNLTEDDCIFLGWYTEPSYANDKKMSLGQTIKNNQILYAKWYRMSDFTNEVIILPPGTNGSAGTDATYVLFGNWPQTLKASDVSIDETNFENHGEFTYYLGSDGYWYIKYSDYFKVEPIKWRILTDNYNGTGRVLLLAEKILVGGVPFSVITNNRYINNITVYPNNYMYSTIRAYLNGKYEEDDTQSKTYKDKGFLQTAFLPNIQNLIVSTLIDNSDMSSIDNGNNTKRYEGLDCQATNDKIFLLSENEVTQSSYGFPSYNLSGIGNTRIRMPTDYAKMKNVHTSSENYYGGDWWLRSPFHYYTDKNNIIIYTSSLIVYTGSANGHTEVSDMYKGIAPAMTITLSN